MADDWEGLDYKEACDKDARLRVHEPSPTPRWCLSEEQPEDADSEDEDATHHTGALAAFLRLYAGHSFEDAVPSVAIKGGELEFKHLDVTRRALILKTWSAVKLQLSIPQSAFMKFVQVWYHRTEKRGGGAYSEVLNLMATVVAQTEAMSDEWVGRNAYQLTKPVARVKRRQYNRAMLALYCLLHPTEGTSGVRHHRRYY
jgi:hypothetical protein